VPLSFDPGEAYQFDWSHEVVLIDGVTTTVKVAHVRLAVLCGCGHNIRMILRHLRAILCRLIWLLTRFRQIKDAEMAAVGPFQIASRIA
jgi:hypothetical protein